MKKFWKEYKYLILIIIFIFIRFGLIGTFELFEKYSDSITALSAVIVALLAIYGIREWKRQVIGKTNYEIARRLIKSSLKLRNAMTYVRNPFVSLSEMEVALKEHGFDSTEYGDKKKTNRAVYSLRWKKVNEAWTDFDVELLDAEVSWGQDVVVVSRPLLKLAQELFSAVQMYLDGHRNNIKDELIYNQGTDELPDDFTNRVSKITNNIREFLKPHLS